MSEKSNNNIKGTVMQIEKALINDRLRVLKASWKFCIRTINNFPVIYPWNLLFSWKVAYFSTVFMVFSVYSKTLRLNNLKTRTAMNAKISIFVLCVEAIIYLLLYSLHDCNFKVVTLFMLKELMKLYFMHYSCMVIILFTPGLDKSIFSTYNFKNLDFRLFMFCVFCLCCFEVKVTFIFFNICIIIAYIGTKGSLILFPP